jgi:hypothetical protein
MRSPPLKKFLLVIVGILAGLLVIILVTNYFRRKTERKQDIVYVAALADKTMTLYKAQMAAIGGIADAVDLERYCQQEDARHAWMFTLRNTVTDNCIVRVKKVLAVPADEAGLQSVIDKLADITTVQGFKRTSAAPVPGELQNGYYGYDASLYDATNRGICSLSLLTYKSVSAGKLNYTLSCQHPTMDTPTGYTRKPRSGY